MKKNAHIFATLLFAFSMSACGQPTNGLKLKEDKLSNNRGKIPSNIVFSYDCLLTDPFSQAAYYTNKAEESAVQMAPVEITTEEENEYGQTLYQEIIKEKKEIKTGAMLEALTQMTNSLLACRPDNCTKLKYTVHLMDDSIVNAYTAGGHIFVNIGLIEYCKTTSELACIIAHEIGHDEKGHINMILKRIKMAGMFGEILYTLKQFTSPSFNQFNEQEADCYGADLAYAAGYDPRAGVKFWERMASDNKEMNDLKIMKFLMSHPFSMERYECMKIHITTNYTSLKFE